MAFTFNYSQVLDLTSTQMISGNMVVDPGGV